MRLLHPPPKTREETFSMPLDARQSLHLLSVAVRRRLSLIKPLSLLRFHLQVSFGLLRSPSSQLLPPDDMRGVHIIPADVSVAPHSIHLNPFPSPHILLVPPSPFPGCRQVLYVRSAGRLIAFRVPAEMVRAFFLLPLPSFPTQIPPLRSLFLFPPFCDWGCLAL